MSRLTPILNFFGKTFHPFKVGKLYITPTYWQALVIVILLFFLVFTLARMRYLYVNWHLGRHSFAMFFWGFLLALIVEGFFIVGGRTLFTEILGMKNAPKPISTILDIGRSRLINVLGISDQIPSCRIIFFDNKQVRALQTRPVTDSEHDFNKRAHLKVRPYTGG